MSGLQLVRGQSPEQQEHGQREGQEEGLEQCNRAAVSSLANLSDLGVRQSAGDKLR